MEIRMGYVFDKVHDKKFRIVSHDDCKVTMCRNLAKIMKI